MCGIAGFCNFNEDFLYNKDKSICIADNMRLSIKRRGNDANGIYVSKHFAFSHARLSIRDLSENGNQPIKHNGYTIVYNGEIYNTEELKEDLIAKGYIFKTTTDTEVILYLFIEYKEKCVSYLNGIFAFAIFDEHNDKLYLFRDRVGVKPLFFTLQDKTLIFASEIKALFKYPNITPRINLESLQEVFGIGPARTDGNGVFKGIFEIKSGYFGIFDKDGFKEHLYWDLISKPHLDNYDDTVERTSYLVNDAIEKQLVSDVEVCTFLSGGLDSSIVTAISSNYLNKFDKKLNTFSFDFKENDIYFEKSNFQPELDRPYVDIMLSNYNLNHNYLECDENNLIELLYKAVDAKDLVGMADVDASMLYFCSIVKEKNKVALTGECADEIFGGYPWFYKEELLNSNTFPWSKNIAFREYFLRDEIKNKLNLEQYSLNKYKDTISKTPYLENENENECKRREISYLNIKWFMRTLLERMDRMSMYSGLEARVPFADHRIIEYVWNVPWDMKYENGVEKALLRKVAKDLLPPKLLNRKKSPYPKTYNPNYERLLKKEIMGILSNNNSPLCHIIDKNKLIKFIEMPSNLSDAWFGQLMATPQMIAYLIQTNYWLSKFNLYL